MTDKNKDAKQGDFKGMPTPKGAAKIALEWLAVQNRISGLEDEKSKIAARVLTAMSKEKRDLIKVQDPDTKVLKQFERDPGHEKLRVKKVPEKVGKNT